MSLPVEKEGEDAIEFKKRMEKVDAIVKNMLEQDNKAAEAKQSKGGKPSSAGIHRWIPIQGNKCWIRRQGSKSKLDAILQGPFAVGQRVGHVAG